MGKRDGLGGLAEAKLGILLGSLLSAVVGYLLLRFGPAPKGALAV